MTLLQMRVNDHYSIARDQSQYICTFHTAEPDSKGEVVKTFPCLLSMHDALINEGYCGNELMNAVSHLLDAK